MIRVALDGLSHGHVAYFLDELERRRDHVELVGIRLYDEAERERVPAWFEGVYAETTDELLRVCRPDVMLLSGWYRQRAAAATTALGQGVHVLADKPLATSVVDLDRLAEAAARSAAHLSVAFEKRWYPATLEARALIAAGALGELRLIAATGPHKLLRDSRAPWFFDERYGPILADLPTHDIDLVLSLTSGSWGTVAGWASPPTPQRGGLSDACMVTMQVEDTVAAHLDAHWLWPAASDVHGRYEMRLTGTQGSIFIDWSTNAVEVVTDAPDVDAAAARALGQEQAKRPSEEFFDALVQGRAPEVTTVDALDASRIALLAAQSATRDGSPQQWQR